MVSSFNNRPVNINQGRSKKAEDPFLQHFEDKLSAEDKSKTRMSNLKFDFALIDRNYKRVKDLNYKIARSFADSIQSEINSFSLFSDLQKEINSIDSDNVIRILNIYNSFTEETLTEAICDEYFVFNKNKKTMITHIQNALQEKAFDLGIDTTDLDKQFENVIKDSFSGIKAFFGYISNSKINNINQIFDNYIKRIQTHRASSYTNVSENLEADLDSDTISAKLDNAIKNSENKYIENTANNVKVRKSVMDRINKLNIAKDDLKGNGKIDHITVQMSGNCLIHASVNSLLLTEAGTEKVNRLIKKQDDKIALYIPEVELAPEKTMSSEHKDGTYVIPENDLLTYSKKYSYGDGDMAALISAVSDYDTTVNTGFSIFRGFEILSGKKVQPFTPDDEIPNGIGSSVIDELNYNKLQDFVTQKQGALVVSLLDIITNVKAVTISDLDNDTPLQGEKPYLAPMHAYSVVKMTDEYVYLKESNFPNVYIKLSRSEFIEAGDALATWKF